MCKRGQIQRESFSYLCLSDCSLSGGDAQRGAQLLGILSTSPTARTTLRTLAIFDCKALPESDAMVSTSETEDRSREYSNLRSFLQMITQFGRLTRLDLKESAINDKSFSRICSALYTSLTALDVSRSWLSTIAPVSQCKNSLKQQQRRRSSSLEL